jgi:hopene-associated glycosyltransferase HpnB
MSVDALAAISAAAWIYLVFARGRFWLADVRDQSAIPPTENCPPVVAIVPARNEADVIGASLEALLSQTYQGAFDIIVVDDDSNDATAARARQCAARVSGGAKLTVISSRRLPAGWSGKLWALKQGIAAAEAQTVPPVYVWLTDADIVHAPDTLTWLVAKAAHDNLVLTSLMARLRCRTLAERIHIPAFVFFFMMLFPFSWVRRADVLTAAAAGGCNLVHLDALSRAGGIEPIRNRLIDDCALAERLKPYGSIWLGLTDRAHSIRRYETIGDIRDMISRCAYAQLNYSPLLLAITLAGMALVFASPPALALLADGPARWLGLATWLAMALSFQPTLRFYRMFPLWGLALPAIALLYASYTLDSAYHHVRREGGRWKARIDVNAQRMR